MDDIYALLNINRCLIQDFSLKANNLVDHQTELAINRSVRSLKEVEERMMSDKTVKVSQQTIDEIMQKVINHAKTNNSDMEIWSIRELRIVSYYLMNLQGNDKAYIYALSLLENNWRDMFFNGLSFYCLDTWNMIDPQLRKYTCELLRNKLTAYNDSNKKYMVMKNHANLFDEAGPLRMSAMISKKNMDVREAPSLFGNKIVTICQSYYSDVIVNYCQEKYIMDLGVIEAIFEVHNLERTKKLVLAGLVERINTNGDEMERTKLCKFANRILGDVTLGTTWAPFPGATDKQAQKLRRAKDLVNLWFNQRIIETFFEVCVQDSYRKNFWLGYIDRLSSFRIVGSTATKRLLQSDNRIGNMFLKYFIETNYSTSQTSALVLFIRNKMLVEFSDMGALYAYNKDHRMVRIVLNRRKSILNINYLKNPSMSNLITINDWGSYNYNSEGRMTHQGDWQSRLKGWMQQMVLSAADTDFNSFESEDNKIFQARPVSKEGVKSDKEAQEPSPKRDLFSPVADREQTTTPLNSSQKIQNTPLFHKPGKLNTMEYETKIEHSIASKWVLNNQCRVVSNENGFYLNVDFGWKYVKICEPTENCLSGSIWIKRKNLNGWLEIVHVFAKNENTIGFFKQNEDCLVFKKDFRQTEFKTIKLR